MTYSMWPRQSLLAKQAGGHFHSSRVATCRARLLSSRPRFSQHAREIPDILVCDMSHDGICIRSKLMSTDTLDMSSTMMGLRQHANGCLIFCVPPSRSSSAMFLSVSHAPKDAIRSVHHSPSPALFSSHPIPRHSPPLICSLAHVDFRLGH